MSDGRASHRRKDRPQRITPWAPPSQQSHLRETSRSTGTNASVSDSTARQQFFALYLQVEELRAQGEELEVKVEELNANKVELTHAQELISDLEADNERIREEVAVSGLNEMQTKLVHENASDIEKNVRPEFKLDWRVLKFMVHLGSGTFGDCYKGSMEGTEVAIKKMRAGLINKDGFEAFSKEVVILANLEHENIVNFRGYCLEPALLIVMDFVEGGTLRDFVVKANESGQVPRPKTVIKILTGCCRALEYLHTMEPAPILHRDIKSENILLTRDLLPRIADLGEARAMAQKTMTAVGTNGYTAPEVLEGRHYGTGADVFSFAIVMSELASLRVPYKEYLKDEDDNRIASWDQIVHLTKTEGLRPTLPDDLDEGFHNLISECWAHEPGLRPSFTVIRLRLYGLLQKQSTKMKKKGSRMTALSYHEEVAEVHELCRGVHDLLWHFRPDQWDEKKAFSIIDKAAKASALDPILHEILASESGPDCAKALGWMMFGGLEDGAEILPEPMLNADVINVPGSDSVLLKMRFAACAPEKIKQWKAKDTRGFDGLATVLAESQSTIESWGTGAFGSAKTKEGSGKKRRRRRASPRKNKKDARLEQFMKAARFVRGHGAAAIHPGAKIELHGLLMQAKEGDCPEGKFRTKREVTLLTRGMKLTRLCSHATVAALLPARVGQPTTKRQRRKRRGRKTPASPCCKASSSRPGARSRAKDRRMR